MINLNKSQLEAHRAYAPLAAGGSPYPLPLYAVLSVLSGLFPTFFSPTPHCFFPLFWMHFSPEALRKGCAVPRCGAAAEPVRTCRGLHVAGWHLPSTQSHRHGGMRALQKCCFSVQRWLQMSSSWAAPSGQVVLGPRCSCCVDTQGQLTWGSSLALHEGRNCRSFWTNLILRLWMIVGS